MRDKLASRVSVTRKRLLHNNSNYMKQESEPRSQGYRDSSIFGVLVRDTSSKCVTVKVHKYYTFDISNIKCYLFTIIL